MMLKDKVALVTSGTSGIGRATALAKRERSYHPRTTGNGGTTRTTSDVVL